MRNTEGTPAQNVAPMALVVCTASLGAWLAIQTSSPGLSVALVLMACASYVVMTTAQHQWGGLSLRMVVGAIVVLCVAAVAVPPIATSDLWWYATYGRIVAVFHVSPYTHAPALFPSNAISQLAGQRWRHQPSVYGPLFTALSAGVSAVVGNATLPTRLAYQLLAVASLAGACTIVWRRTRRPAALAFLALNPVVATYLLNGGRNDILVGAAVLASVALAMDGHERSAGLVGGLGALVKLTGLVGVAAVTVTMLATRGRRSALRVAGVAGAVVTVGYAFVGRVALETPMHTAGKLFSSSSVWRIGRLVGTSLPAPRLALVVLAIVTGGVLYLFRRALPGSVTASVVALLAGASYTLPGYAGWVLPTAALDHDSRVSHLAAWQAALLVGGYEVVRHPISGPVGSALRVAAHIALPVGSLVLLVLLVREGWRMRTSRPSIPATATSDTRAARPMPRVLVVVPTYNEVGTIGTLLQRVRRAVPDATVLVVDDNSPDGTAEQVEAVAASLGGIELLRRPAPLGLGTAYRDGFRAALARGFDAVVEMDADLSHDPSALPSLLRSLDDGADLVIGSRYAPGGSTPGWSRSRRYLSRGGCWYARTLLRLPVRDATSGYRAYRVDALRAVPLDSLQASGYGFQIEMVHQLARAHAIVVEAPITFTERAAGMSKMSRAIVLEALVLVTRWALEEWTIRLRSHLVRRTQRPVVVMR